jgi:uncharacterized protein (DUF1330 family)
MSAIVPNADQIQKLAADPDQGPVVMLNLLKFKPRAEGEEGTGADAYRRYGEKAIKMIEACGGRLLWSGRPSHILVGSDADNWDMIVLVEYPSPRAFFEMATSAEYQQIHVHREAGLERTVLIANRTLQTPGAF